MKLPLLNGNEIIPVRLIPLITGRALGAETLSGILANRLQVSGWPFSEESDEIEVEVYDEETGRLERKTITRDEMAGPQGYDNGITAYHLDEENRPIAMWSSEWDEIYSNFKLLKSVLRKCEEWIGVPGMMRPVWRSYAINILPPGVFLWRDDLDLLWQAHVSCFIPMPHEPRNFREINYDAYLRPEYRKLVTECFEQLLQDGSIGQADGKEDVSTQTDITEVARIMKNKQNNTEIEASITKAVDWILEEVDKEIRQFQARKEQYTVVIVNHPQFWREYAELSGIDGNVQYLGKVKGKVVEKIRDRYGSFQIMPLGNRPRKGEEGQRLIIRKG